MTDHVNTLRGRAPPVTHTRRSNLRYESFSVSTFDEEESEHSKGQGHDESDDRYGAEAQQDHH